MKKQILLLLALVASQNPHASFGYISQKLKMMTGVSLSAIITAMCQVEMPKETVRLQDVPTLSLMYTVVFNILVFAYHGYKSFDEMPEKKDYQIIPRSSKD